MASRPEYRLKPKLTKICDVCGKDFVSSWKRHKRCSRECSLHWHRNEYQRYIWPYGISKDDYNEMFGEQKGKCKICQRHQANIKGKLNVDHDHETGEVRSLLCNQCNQALGLLREDPETIKRMWEYVL